MDAQDELLRSALMGRGLHDAPCDCPADVEESRIDHIFKRLSNIEERINALCTYLGVFLAYREGFDVVPMKKDAPPKAKGKGR